MSQCEYLGFVWYYRSRPYWNKMIAKIIAESPDSWQKKIIIHVNPYIIQYFSQSLFMLFQEPLLSSRSSRHSHEASLSHTHHHHNFQKNQRQLYQPSSWLDHLYHHPYFLHHHHHKHHQHRHQHQQPHHTLRLHASRRGNRCLTCQICMVKYNTDADNAHKKVGWAVLHFAVATVV